jgi:hypothetical protein
MNNPRLAHLTGLKPKPPKPRPVALYSLHDTDGQTRWIGTAYSPEARLRAHWRAAKVQGASHNEDLAAWLSGLAEPPELRILAWLEESERWETEARATAAMREQNGSRLLNKRDGRLMPRTD